MDFVKKSNFVLSLFFLKKTMSPKDHFSIFMKEKNHF